MKCQLIQTRDFEDTVEGLIASYLYIEDRLILFLLFIYAKNEQANLSQSEKIELKQLADSIKRRIRNE